MTVATNTIANRYDLNSTNFVAGAKQANQAIDNLIKGNVTLGDAIAALRQKLLGMGTGAAFGAAAVAGLGIVLTKVVSSAISLGQELQTMSNRTGESVSALARLKFAAEQEDVSLGLVSQALRVLSQRAVAAANNNEEAAKSFRDLGVDIRDANGKIKSGTQLLAEVGKGLERIRPGTERTAAAVAVLGRSGQQLIPLVTNLDNLNKRFEELGLGIGPAFARNADEFGDRMGELKFVTDRFGVAIAEALLPALNDFLRLATDALVPILKLMVDHSDELAFSLFKTGKAFEFAGFLGLGFAKSVGRNGPIAAAKQLVDEYNKTLGVTREQYDKLQTAESPAAVIEETGAAAAEAAARMRELAQQTASFFAIGEGADESILARAEELRVRTLESLARNEESARLLAGRPSVAEERAQQEREQFRPLEPIALQGVETTVSATANSAEAFAQFLSDARVQAELLNTPLAEAEESFQGFSAFAGNFTDALVSSAQGAKLAFQDFFKSLLANLAKAIIRALVLRAILSIFGGVPSIGKILGAATGQAQGALGFQDQESSMLGRASQARSLGIGGGPLAGASGLPTPNVTVTPRVVVNQATPATWVQITDEQIMPRLRTRQRRLNDDLR